MSFRKTPDGLVIGPNKSLTAEDQKLLLLIYQMKGHHNAGLTIGQVWRTFSERSKKSLRNQLRTLDSKGVIFYSKNGYINISEVGYVVIGLCKHRKTDTPTEQELGNV